MLSADNDNNPVRPVSRLFHKSLWISLAIGIGIMATIIALILVRRSSLHSNSLHDLFSGYQHFEFTQAGVHFSYPKDWYTEADHDSKDLISFSAVPPENFSPRPPNFDVYYISTKNSSLTSEIEDLSSPIAILKSLEKFGYSFEKINQSSVDGYPSASGVISMGNINKILYLVIVRKNKISTDQVNFVFSSPSAQWDQVQPVIRNIIKSIEILPIP